MKRLHVWKIGCQMNDADAASLGRALAEMGFVGGAPPEQADLLILVTCVVRQSAEDKVVSRLDSLKGLKRRHPDLLLVVMGCFVENEQELCGRFPWVDGFFRPSDICGLLNFVRSRLPPGPPDGPPPAVAPVSVSIPISYGCDHHCTYCIVRLRRGTQQSRPPDDILTEARAAVESGAREVMLLGQNVDAYGKDLGPAGRADLGGLLTAVSGIDGLLRLRFLTSHPADMSTGLIENVARLKAVCPHFELPVQSGDDLVLRMMGRGYTAAQYSALVALIREKVPGCSIATDVIVGFPGESRQQFQATLDLVLGLRFDSVHIAKYSPRPGTPGARMLDDVPAEEKESRRKQLEQVQTRISQEINAAYMGRTVLVLVEERHRGRWKGRTVTNRLVFFEDSDDWRGQLVGVEIVRSGPWALRGLLKR